MAQKGSAIHIGEVKTLQCSQFPSSYAVKQADRYDPADNLSPHKPSKVRRTAEWYLAQNGWEREWQIREARVRYPPQVG